MNRIALLIMISAMSINVLAEVKVRQTEKQQPEVNKHVCKHQGKTKHFCKLHDKTGQHIHSMSDKQMMEMQELINKMKTAAPEKRFLMLRNHMRQLRKVRMDAHFARMKKHHKKMQLRRQEQMKKMKKYNISNNEMMESMMPPMPPQSSNYTDNYMMSQNPNWNRTPNFPQYRNPGYQQPRMNIPNMVNQSVQNQLMPLQMQLNQMQKAISELSNKSEKKK
ncbi:MAG: hypothetical protein HON94_08845 [Methylococcales bacterium]|jgi:hypothetical protein|nr:hypothetical protein [Methylococcales bacterium]MBT7408889.1 hypothetical protein [Methylococcales bacterium]